MTQPYVEVHVDFDEDGDFESGEEISGDVMSFAIQRGKEISQHRAAAGVLDLTLDNTDQKYSPENTNSPLHPFTLPGPEMRVRMAWPYDDFTGTVNTDLDGTTPNLGPDGEDWVADTTLEFGTGGVWVQQEASGTNIGILEFNESNVVIAAECFRGAVTGGFPYKDPIFVFRYADSSNFSYLSINLAASALSDLVWKVHEVVAGTDTELGTILTETVTDLAWSQAVDWAEIILRVMDDTVELIVWGDQGTATGSLSGLTASLASNTKHGIGGNGYTNTSGFRWRHFGLQTVFRGRVDLVEPQVISGNETAYIRGYDDMERLGLHVLFSGTTDMLPASSGDIAGRILDRGGFTGPRLIDDGTDPLTPAQVSTANNQNGVPVETGTVMGGNALAEMYQLQDDEVGFFYIDKYGCARFEASDHRDGTASLATWDDNHTQITNPTWREPIEWDAGIERVENEVYYEYFRFAKTLSTTVWFLEPDDDPQFTEARKHPNTTDFVIIDIAAIGEELAIANPKIPLPVTDYTVRENADGTGVNWLTPIKTESGTVTLTGSPDYELDDTAHNFITDTTSIDGINFSVSNKIVVIQDATGRTAVGTIDSSTDIDGDGTLVVVVKWPEDTETSPKTPGYISMDEGFDETDTPITYDVYVVGAFVLDGFEGNYRFLRFFGDALMNNGNSASHPFITSAKVQADKLSASVPAAARAEDSTSQTTHGRRRIRHVTKHIRDWDTAAARAEARVAARKDPKERLVVHMRNSSELNIKEIMFRDVSDKINVEYTAMDLDDDYHIENYRLRWEQDGFIEVRWELVKA